VRDGRDLSCPRRRNFPSRKFSLRRVESMGSFEREVTEKIPSGNLRRRLRIFSTMTTTAGWTFTW